MCACESMVVFLSSESIRSDMVRKEVAVAHGLGKRIFPVRVDYDGALPYDSHFAAQSSTGFAMVGIGRAYNRRRKPSGGWAKSPNFAALHYPLPTRAPKPAR